MVSADGCSACDPRGHDRRDLRHCFGAHRPKADQNAPAYLTVAIRAAVAFDDESGGPSRGAGVSSRQRDVIDAPAEAVWKKRRHLLRYRRRAGVWYFALASPIRSARAFNGRRCGRHANMRIHDAGTFIEPIEVWNEPHLRGSLSRPNPPPMRELSPYGRIDAPHLHGFLVSQRGQFALESLPGGRTRLTGSTGISITFWPAEYCGFGRMRSSIAIHLRVLRASKVLSERRPPDRRRWRWLVRPALDQP